MSDVYPEDFQPESMYACDICLDSFYVDDLVHGRCPEGHKVEEIRINPCE